MNRILSCGAALAALAISGELRAADAATERETAAAKVEVDAAVSLLARDAERVRALVSRARGGHRAAEVACLDPALSRVDVALRYGRDHAKHATAAWSRGDVRAAREEMQGLSWRVSASRDAMKMADACAPSDVVVRASGTVVRVWIDPTLPTDVADYPPR